MAFKRRNVEIFSLSFLDCICCGFGAVILFYTIISAQSGAERATRNSELRAEVNKLEEEVRTGTRNLVVLRNTMEKTNSETASDAEHARRLISEMESKREQLSSYDATSTARRERIERLKADIRSLEQGTRRLEGAAAERGAPGQEVAKFRDSGGHRQYITGLKLHGKRILILVDRSGSMLHEDLVNVILLRNSSQTAKRNAAKWRRAIDTVTWLVTQLPARSQFQIYGFNTQALPVLATTGGKWQSADDPRQRSVQLEALRALVPEAGTSLANAFIAARAMTPMPDQIVLITDGLPTQGKTAGGRRYITADGRASLFDEAVALDLPKGVPFDIVLLPMRGDLPAAYRFWQLARLSKGSLMMPSKDWP